METGHLDSQPRLCNILNQGCVFNSTRRCLMTAGRNSDANLELARRYLKILERDPEDPELHALFDPEFVFYERPNRLNPNGRTLPRDALRALTAKAKQITLEQRYEVVHALAVGDEVAMEVEWTGRFNLAFASTPAGQPI